MLDVYLAIDYHGFSVHINTCRANTHIFIKSMKCEIRVLVERSLI